MISPRVKHFIFKASRPNVFNYLPGQFITIHFDHEGKPLKRSYSIANAPQQDNIIEFAAGFFEGGPGTELLFNLKSGDRLQVSGPYGRLTLKDELPGRYILIATSTGVTPYRAMISELSQRLAQQPTLQILILLGVQKREDLLYAKEFLDWGMCSPQVSFKACLSRVPVEELQENEFHGHVQALFPELSLDTSRDLVYLCGNPNMIDEAFNELKERGFAIQQIIREKYISR